MISLRRAVGRGVEAAVRAPRQSTRSVGATRLLTAHSAPRDDLRSAPVNRVVGVAPLHSDTHTARALHTTPVHRSSADSEVPNLSFEDHLEIVSQHLDMLQRNNKFGQGLKKIRVGPTHLPNSPTHPRHIDHAHHVLLHKTWPTCCTFIPLPATPWSKRAVVHAMHVSFQTL